jgi:tetratricopeptide (TPR) repeat protein
LADLYKKEGLLGNAKVLYQNIVKLNPDDQVARRGISEIDQTLAGVTPIHRGGEMPAEISEGDLGQDSVVSNEPLVLDDIPEIQEPPSDEQADTDQEIFELEDPLDLPPGVGDAAPTPEQKTEDSPYFTHQKVILDDDVPPEKDLESHYHLGVAYLEMDLIDQAIEEFEAALSYAPKKIDCLVMLGRCYLQKGVFDRSISYLEEASRSEGLTHEEYVRIYRQLGEVYEACGMKEEAGRAFQRATVAEEKSPG